jgi:hypothetical protein
MLDPHDRHVYLDALKPPDGYVFGEAVAATYSLDLETLLSVPVALVLPHLDPARLTAEHAVDVLQALRQASSRLTIFCDAANVATPPPGVLYSLLEPVIVQARAPHGGSLHAKFWLIRFDAAPGEDVRAAWMRLFVLSRNLTNDRSWDVSVMLDGDLGAKRKVNNPLVQLLEKLSSCAIHPMADAARIRVARLAEQVGRTEWELPDGFEDLAFHALGIGAKPKSWSPLASDRLVVISPFVTQPALKSLQESTREAVALISRGDELDHCDAACLRDFEAVWVLADRAAAEDGDDTSGTEIADQLRGLHAKAYVAKCGWNTHLYLGSANATTTALVAGRSIELMVELSGRTKAVPGKGLEGLLATGGLGGMLARYEPPAVPPAPDPGVKEAEDALRNASSALARAGLKLTFNGNNGEHTPLLQAAAPVELHGVERATAWLITSDVSSARSIEPLSRGQPIPLANCTPATATAFIGFELFATAAAVSKQFVLNLPSESMPADRDAHIVRIVVKNKERLIRYILGLLQGLDPFVRTGLEAKRRQPSWGASTPADAGLLEHLVRTKARCPERLDDVRVLLKSLAATPEGRQIIPRSLTSLWTTVTGEMLE